MFSGGGLIDRVILIPTEFITHEDNISANKIKWNIVKYWILYCNIIIMGQEQMCVFINWNVTILSYKCMILILKWTIELVIVDKILSKWMLLWPLHIVRLCLTFHLLFVQAILWCFGNIQECQKPDQELEEIYAAAW